MAKAKHLLLASLVASLIFFSVGYAAGSEAGPGVRVIDEHHIQIEPSEAGVLYIQVGKETITYQDQGLLPPQLRRQETCFSP
jgi:hypothetical protein